MSTASRGSRPYSSEMSVPSDPLASVARRRRFRGGWRHAGSGPSPSGRWEDYIDSSSPYFHVEAAWLVARAQKEREAEQAAAAAAAGSRASDHVGRRTAPRQHRPARDRRAAGCARRSVRRSRPKLRRRRSTKPAARAPSSLRREDCSAICPRSCRYRHRMGFFKRQMPECPFCGAQVDDGPQTAHFLTHLEDRPGGRLGLPCGHPDAEWNTSDDFPTKARDHMRRSHGLRL